MINISQLICLCRKHNYGSKVYDCDMNNISQWSGSASVQNTIRDCRLLELCVLVDDIMITISQLICICTKDMIRDVTGVTWRQIHSGDI